MSIFLTSDLHFSHGNIIKFCKRPFTSITEMNDVLIQNYNKTVRPTDTTYILGDFAWDQHEEQIERLFKKLNGKKHFILGNHDRAPIFRSLANRGVLESVHDMFSVNVGQQHIVLCHYPLRSWNKSFHGSFHAFGHNHGTVSPWGLSCDIGVDSWGYAPLSIDTFQSVMAKLPRQFAEGNDTSEKVRWSGLEFLNGAK